MPIVDGFQIDTATFMPSLSIFGRCVHTACPHRCIARAANRFVGAISTCEEAPLVSIKLFVFG